MMKRRRFLILSTFLGYLPYVYSKTNDNTLDCRTTIASVQQHLFPKGNEIPSAEELNAINYFFDTIKHTSFDEELEKFLYLGAEKLQLQCHGNFTQLAYKKKENSLRKFEETTEGKLWLQQVILLTLEAFFGDPIYGANVKSLGWKSLQVEGGNPRPRARYLNL